MIPRWQRKIARERISILLRLAEQEVREHSERSTRYVELAGKIGMRYKVRPPKKYKRKVCKKCNAFLKPGLTCTVRLVPKERCVVWRCSECGRERRYPYSKK